MRSYWLLSLVLLAACQHAARVASTVAPASDPMQYLTDAPQAFRRGDFARALVAFRQLQFELAPGDALTAEAHYYTAECSFQIGDLTAAVIAFQKVAEEFPNSEFAALALLRDGDANLRLWRRPDVDASNGQTALST
jgi:TolA-binding protein